MKQTPNRSSIEADLEFILKDIDRHTWTIRELLFVLHGKGYPFLVILMSLPFCQPIQVPGFSTFFGIFIAFLGLRMVFGKWIFWPEWILKKEISNKALQLVVRQSLRFFKFLRPCLHPRIIWLSQDRFYYAHGFFIALMGGYLALPLPIPLTNLLAAWALLLIALGILEEDGVFICIGYVVGCFALSLLGFVFNFIQGAVAA